MAKEWRCFHCDVVFINEDEARAHFGPTQHDESYCCLSAERVRAIELELYRYRDEDTDLHREIARLRSDHATALRREEETGYARGIEDSAKMLERYEKVLRAIAELSESFRPICERALTGVDDHG